MADTGGPDSNAHYSTADSDFYANGFQGRST